MEVKKIKIVKFCGKCRLEKPLEEFHKSRKRTKSICRDCVKEESLVYRQARLKKLSETNPNIEQCECGNYYSSTTGGKVRKVAKTMCNACERLNPLVKAYVKELGRSVWVKLPRGYGKLL